MANGNVYYVFVAQHPALVTGGMEGNTWVQLLYFKPLDGLMKVEIIKEKKD